MSKDGGRNRSTEALYHERDVLLASLADLERERAAGDFDEADYEQLRARYTTRAASALRALQVAAQLPVKDARRSSAWTRSRRFLGRARTRRWLIVGISVCFFLLVALLVTSLSGVRLFGEQSSGSVSLPTSVQVRQQLAEASILGSQGQLSSAIALYNAVLVSVPNQPEALTYKGWLERLSGIAANSARTVSAGDALVAHATAIAPGYADARALYGVALLEDKHDSTAAVKQFQALMKDKPSANLLRAVGPRIAVAYAKAGRKLPSSLRGYA